MTLRSRRLYRMARASRVVLLFITLSSPIGLAMAFGQSGPPSTPSILAVPQHAHADAIISAAFPMGGRVLATGSSDGTVKLWSAESPSLLRTLPGYEGGRLHAARSGAWLLAGPDEPRVAGADSGGLRFTSQLWDVRTGRMLLDAEAIALTEDGDLAVVAETNAGGGGLQVRLVEPGTGRTLRPIDWTGDHVTILRLSPDGRVLAIGGGESVEIWEVETGSKLRSIALPGTPLEHEATFAAGGSRLAIALDGAVAIVDVASGALSTIQSAAFHLVSDGALLAALAEDGTVSIVEIATGRTVASLPGDIAARVAFDPAGRIVAVGIAREQRVDVWDLASGQRLWSAAGAFLHGFAPRGTGLAITVDGRIELRKSADGTRLQGYAAPDDEFTFKEVWFGPTGDLMATAGWDRGIILWETATGRVRRTIEKNEDWIVSVAVSPDGRLLATAESGSVRLWDLESGVPSGRLELPAGGEPDREIARVAFDPADGALLVTDSYAKVARWSARAGAFGEVLEDWTTFNRDGTVLARETETGIEVRNAKTGRLLRSFGDGFESPVVLDPAGKSIFLQRPPPSESDAESLATTVERIDVRTGRRLQRYRIPEGVFDKLALSPDGSRLAAAHGSARLTYSVTVFDVATGRSIVRKATDPDGASSQEFNQPSVIGFSPDGAVLGVGNADSAIELWDARTLERRHVLRGHTGLVWSLAFSRDGAIAISGGTDATTRFWSVETGEELCTLVTTPGGDWIAVAPDGLFDGSPEGWTQILWASSSDLFDTSSSEIFFNDFFAPGLLADVVAGRRREAPRAIGGVDRRQPRVGVRLVGSATEGRGESRTVDLEIEVAQAPPDSTQATGSGARDVRLFRNGALFRTWRGDVLGGGSSATLRADDVPITAGENVFTVYAFNRDDVKSQDATVTVVGAKELERAGTLFVLSVGIDAYSNPNFNLRYAVADAEAFGDTLVRSQRAIGRFGEIVQVTLRNGEATNEALERALARLAGSDADTSDLPASLGALRPAQPEDAVVIYFAGHGTAYRDRFYLIPSAIPFDGARTEIDAAAMDAITSASVSDRDLEMALEGVDAGEILLVIDACNSGQALEAGERRRGPMNTPGLAQLAYEKGMFVLTAAQSYQAALEAQQLGHGYLTYALVEEGIARRAADLEPVDGAITITEWLDYAVRRVPAMQRERLEQARILHHDVTFVEGEEERPLAEKSLQRPRAYSGRGTAGRRFVVARGDTAP